ncbi:hypothetical protein H8R02_29900 [Ramlibacter sp. GTP1]|uniref:Uncharacterized protein n=1 Tax=Ramlibacter albus TaxID=2079448 RepID=A0A923S949_9BURK|nr:hypothetical protein [Ramlibacter albus]
MAERIADRSSIRIGLGFNHNQVLAYDANSVWFKQAGFEVLHGVSRLEFEATLREKVFAVLAGTPLECPLRVAVDISCFDRFRIASLVDLFERLSGERELSIDYWYNIAAFERPRPTLGRNEVAGPVHRRYAGRFLDPGLPLALIAGLGYELGKVVGVTEYLQASRVVAMFPVSPISEYEPEVVAANQTLLEDLQDREIIRYLVDDPRKAVATLDSLIRGLSNSHNVVLFPGGPKLFVLCSVIAASAHPEVAVWRVSSDTNIRPKDVRPSQTFIGLRQSFARTGTTATG